MRILKVEPGKAPYEKDIPEGLESLQKEVDGRIEVTYPFDDLVGVVCNEEGKMMGMELNRALHDDEGKIYDIIAGPFLVVGLSDENFQSLTDEQAAKFTEKYMMAEQFMRMGDEIISIPYDPPESQPARSNIEHEER